MITGINIAAAEGDASESPAAVPEWASPLASHGPFIRTDLSLEDPEGKPLPVLHADSETDLLLVPECDSTMEMVVRLAADGKLPAWGAVLAVRQRSGRGQMRRYWVSMPGNLHASFLLPSMAGADPAWNRILPLTLGHCLRQALRRLGAEVELKWPNDLVQRQDKTLLKISGLLIEDRGGYVVAGFGLNLTAAPKSDQLRENHPLPAGIIKFSKEQPASPLLWLALVKWVKKEYQALLENTAPPDFIARLSQELLWMGERGTLREGDAQRPVTLLGLAPDGGLRILDDRGETVIYSGSISQNFSADVRP